MNGRARWGWAVAFAALAGCGSVAVPREQYFRLALPPAAAAPHGGAGVLRVFDLQLGRSVDADCLMIGDGLRLEPRPLARWVAPLDRLVTDALVLALARGGACALVKGPADPGAETWALHGRIVEFGEVVGPGGREARVLCELWLEQDGRLLFTGEFAAAEALAGNDAEAAVAALSRGLHEVAAAVVERMERNGLFAAAPPVAAPGR